MGFIEDLKEVRKERNLKQKDVAKMLGISAQSYNQYETGKRKPKHETILKLCDVLDCAYIYKKSGEPHLYTFRDVPQAETPAEKAHMKAQLDAIKRRFANDLQSRLQANFDAVNVDGQKKIVDYSDDIASNAKYKNDKE